MVDLVKTFFFPLYSESGGRISTNHSSLKNKKQIIGTACDIVWYLIPIFHLLYYWYPKRWEEFEQLSVPPIKVPSHSNLFFCRGNESDRFSHSTKKIGEIIAYTKFKKNEFKLLEKKKKKKQNKLPAFFFFFISFYFFFFRFCLRV